MGGSPKTPTVTPAPVMPTPDDEAIAKAKKRQAQTIANRTGRASTILSQGQGAAATEETLGGF